jgi:hypothetical protein
MNAHATINSGTATGWFNWDPPALMVDQQPMLSMLRPFHFEAKFLEQIPPLLKPYSCLK